MGQVLEQAQLQQQEQREHPAGSCYQQQQQRRRQIPMQLAGLCLPSLPPRLLVAVASSSSASRTTPHGLGRSSSCTRQWPHLLATAGGWSCTSSRAQLAYQVLLMPKMKGLSAVALLVAVLVLVVLAAALAGTVVRCSSER